MNDGAGHEHEHEHPAWQLLDAVVYLAAGLCAGVLLAVVLGRGKVPRIPDNVAELVDAYDTTKE